MDDGWLAATSASAARASRGQWTCPQAASQTFTHIIAADDVAQKKNK